jgi:hypothetical protein
LIKLFIVEESLEIKAFMYEKIKIKIFISV